MENDGIRNKDNGGFGNEDNNRDVLNEYLLEETWLEDVGGDNDDDVSICAGSSGSDGGVEKVFAVDFSH
jgi:hypothetical protein